MLSSVGLEVMNSTNAELNWKTVTKGRRSRKSVARSLNSVVKVGNCISPKRVGDFSGSDSDKFGEVVLGQSTSGKSENVPLKKRRHLLQSPQPHPWASSLRRQDSASPITHSSSPLSENHDQLQYHSCSSGHRSSSWHLRGVEGSPKVGGGDGLLRNQTESVYNLAGDFSGIELLAAAASMDDDTDNADKMDLLDITMQKNSETSSSATLSKVSLKNESEDFSSNMKVCGSDMDTQQKNSAAAAAAAAAASKSLCGSPEDGSMPNVSRHHWDLNTLMDAWDEPSDDLNAGDTAKEVRDDMHMEGQRDSRDLVYSNPGGTRDVSSDLKIEVNNSSSVSEDRICSEYRNLGEHLQEQQKNIYSNAATEVSEQADEKNLDDGNSIQVLNCDGDVKSLNEFTSTDAVLDSSLFTKLCCTSGMLMSEEKANSISGTVAIMQDEDCSSNVSGCERGTDLGEICARTQDVNSHDLTVSGSDIGISRKDTEDCRESSKLPGTFTQDVQPVLIADSNKQNDGCDRKGHFEPAEYDPKHEDNDHPNDGLKSSLEDTLKSCSAGAQSDNLTTSIERIGSLIDGRRVSDISQDYNNNVHMVDGDDFTQQGYDSPFEDGELRGSFFCLLEDNEMENECVDYESDGRNGDGSDAADCLGSEIVEGGSESSHGTRRSLSLKASPESKSKSVPIKHSLRKHSVKDDSDNNEIAGKGSNAGSGTTVEQCIGMGMGEQDDMKRRQLIDRRGTVDEKVTDMDEYASKMMGRGKLQSRIEGRSSAEATNRKDVFFMQQCRPRRLVGSYSRAERDISPDRYMGRYNRSTTHGERDGVHQWASWGSRKRYASNYQGPDGRYPIRPRNKISESVDGADFHDPGQTAHYMTKGLHRPLLRRSPPVERDEYFGAGRRIVPTRGVGNYRSRGHYSQRGGRDFVEDFEPLPDDAVRMPRYISRRDRSFSPSAGRGGHMALPRRSRSRSRTRSPRPWHPRRERIFGTRKHSRSPEFRSERMRLPLSKPPSDYGEDYMPLPSRGPQRNIRWVDDRNFVDTRRRRSPVRVFRRNQNQRFDGVGPSGRLKSDDYFRSVRPGRFSLMGNGGEPNFDDRRRGGGDEAGEMMHHRALQHSEERRFRQNAAGDDDDFGTNNMNNEEDVGAQPQGDEKI